MMPQIAPIHIKLGMIIHVHELVRQRLFHLLLAPEVTRAEKDRAGFGGESARARLVAGKTEDMLRRREARACLLGDALEHEAHRRAFRMLIKGVRVKVEEVVSFVTSEPIQGNKK